MCEHAKNVSSEKGANDPPDRRPADSTTAAGAPAQREHLSTGLISSNEHAIYEKLDRWGWRDEDGPYDRWAEIDPQEGGKRVKHYLIAWEDDDTAVLGIKAENSPYGGGGYGLGYPALAGGTSEMSGDDRNRLGSGLLPSYAMRNWTLSKEVEQELWDKVIGKRNPYRLNVSADIRFVSQGSDDRNVYKTWEGEVTRQPNDLQDIPKKPNFRGRPNREQSEQLAYFENTGTVRVKVSDLAGTLGGQPTKEDVLREVAKIAEATLPENVNGVEHAEKYLASDNFPLQAFAKRMIEKIEAYRRRASTTSEEGEAEEDASMVIHDPDIQDQKRGEKRKAEDDLAETNRESDTSDQSAEEEAEAGEAVRGEGPPPSKRQKTEASGTVDSRTST